MSSKYSLPGSIAVKSWGFGTGTNLKSSSVKMSDFARHLKRQMVEGNDIKRGDVTLTVVTRTPPGEEEGEVEVKAQCEVAIGEETGQIKLEIWAKKPGTESTVQISKGKRVDIKFKNAALETIIIPDLKSFIDGELVPSKKETKSFKCNMCDVSTRSELYLKLHIRKVHESEDLQCDSCSYKASESSILRGHIMTKHNKMESQFHCSTEGCDFKCGSNNDLKLHITASHDSSLCSFCGEYFISERFLRQHMDDAHIADTENVMKRQLSSSSRCEPKPKQVKPDSEQANLSELVVVLEKKLNESEAVIKDKEATLFEYKVLIDELMDKNTKLESERLNMLDTNTKFQNKMIEKNTRLEEKVKELKELIEPDNEMEQLTTLLAGKNQSYARTVTGSVPKTNIKKVCGVCRLVCETDRKYKNHMKSHNSEGDWCCDKCDFQTNTKTELDKHMSSFVHEVHDERKTEPLINSITVKCTVCEDTFWNKTE